MSLGPSSLSLSSMPRVLHFKMNPTAQLEQSTANNALAELQAEAVVLRQRLGELSREVEESRKVKGNMGLPLVECADADESPKGESLIAGVIH